MILNLLLHDFTHNINYYRKTLENTHIYKGSINQAAANTGVWIEKVGRGEMIFDFGFLISD